MSIFISFSSLNWWSIAAVTVFSFVLGALWHSDFLFGKIWSKESGTKYNKENHGNPALIFGISGILHLIAVIALAIFIGSDATALTGFLKGLFVSLVWVSTGIGVNYIFAGRSFRLFLIDAGFYVVFLSLAGLMLTAWD
jgi:hypothetical protein